MEVVTHAGTHELRYVLPDKHGVSTGVYEYGGGAYEVLPLPAGVDPADDAGRPQVIFSDARDGNAVKLLNADSGEVRTVIGDTPWLRYSEFSGCASSRWVLAIEL